jgi:DNA-directed RNA polymerase subunit N (RpoN/RPB10)
MGPAGYTVKLEQWEEEDRQLATAGTPNPYDAYPDDRSKNWIRARSKLVIKDRVVVIVFNNKEAEKLFVDIKEKIACAESSGMAGRREYDVLSQCLGRPEQHCRVCGVSSYQGWKYAWPQHVEMYRKKKRTKTDTSVDMEKIKEQIKQELVAEMRMQNMQMQRWCCHQMVLSPMSNRASPSPATLKSSCASADLGLIDGTAELVTEVRCDDRTHEDLIGMLTEPTHCGLWITWRGIQCEAALGLVHPEETTLRTVLSRTALGVPFNNGEILT